MSEPIAPRAPGYHFEPRKHRCVTCGAELINQSGKALYCPQCKKIRAANLNRRRVLAYRAAKSGKPLHDLLMQDKAKGGGV